ncbi:hypothetical protein PPL_06165 [Heterostelium album PN500]|uniref:Uncharacterized protein n=1 Tax=Heterostelium pallidum (strain ATCC 26659 / Pp 5 / PN500) TaxID=670386 RepID=D3BCE0_HETP5|nr:hypothetical protein PPL_06165 [Heterostelium album PN500]EFA80930.1 hypothetical protein PPL_06165 [Heterostelium album PN500]|eukprot:XP_020433048.1 hypothetical protein PPL_06165 [Heterostelium album PN500]
MIPTDRKYQFSNGVSTTTTNQQQQFRVSPVLGGIGVGRPSSSYTDSSSLPTTTTTATTTQNNSNNNNNIPVANNYSEEIVDHLHLRNNNNLEVEETLNNKKIEYWKHMYENETKDHGYTTAQLIHSQKLNHYIFESLKDVIAMVDTNVSITENDSAESTIEQLKQMVWSLMNSHNNINNNISMDTTTTSSSSSSSTFTNGGNTSQRQQRIWWN